MDADCNHNAIPLLIFPPSTCRSEVGVGCEACFFFNLSHQIVLSSLLKLEFEIYLSDNQKAKKVSLREAGLWFHVYHTRRVRVTLSHLSTPIRRTNAAKNITRLQQFSNCIQLLFVADQPSASPPSSAVLCRHGSPTNANLHNCPCQHRQR